MRWKEAEEWHRISLLRETLSISNRGHRLECPSPLGLRPSTTPCGEPKPLYCDTSWVLKPTPARRHRELWAHKAGGQKR